ncbi:MAG: DUF1343 domain-containing protein [Candidatus Competibacteraceae bacterium]|nr:DUF1343 domain-containing protein [Candidatus Competibacteraceae bacterium]
MKRIAPRHVPRSNHWPETLIHDRPETVRGARIGVVCHPASVDAELRHALDLLQAAGARIEAIFGPEHGARGEAQDMEGVEDMALDPRLRVPVPSLYGATFDSLPPAPGATGQAGCAGDRFTGCRRVITLLSGPWRCAWTRPAKAGVRVVVCDRPNPIDGLTVEGNLIKPGFESFVGLHPSAEPPRLDARRNRPLRPALSRHRMRSDDHAAARLAARHVL